MDFSEQYTPVDLVRMGEVTSDTISAWAWDNLNYMTSDKLADWGAHAFFTRWTELILGQRLTVFDLGPPTDPVSPEQDVDEDEEMPPVEIAIQYVRDLITAFKAFAKRPHLFGYCKQVFINFQSLNHCVDVGPMITDEELLDFGQNTLINIGLYDESINDWNTPDGWTALLLMEARSAFFFSLAGDFDGGAVPRIRGVAELVRRHRIIGPFQSLSRVFLINTRADRDMMNPIPGDHLTDLFSWASIPTVNWFTMGNFAQEDVAYLRYPAMRTRLQRLTLGQTSISPGSLDEIIDHNRALSSFTLTYNSRFESQALHTSHARVDVYMNVIQKTKNTLQRLMLNFPCGNEASARALASTSAITDVGVTEPDFDLHDIRNPDPGSSDGNLDQNLGQAQADYLFIGSLRRFEKLELLVVPSYMLYNQNSATSFIDLFPASLKHLVLVDDLRRSRDIMSELIRLVGARRALGPEYPELKTLVLPQRPADFELMRACTEAGVLLVTATLNMDLRRQFVMDRMPSELDWRGEYNFEVLPFDLDFEVPPIDEATFAL